MSRGDNPWVLDCAADAEIPVARAEIEPATFRF